MSEKLRTATVSGPAEKGLLVNVCKKCHKQGGEGSDGEAEVGLME